jgi:hypothetical protein
MMSTCCSNHVEAKNKYTKKECIKLVITQNCIKMHGQQNIKRFFRHFANIVAVIFRLVYFVLWLIVWTQPPLMRSSVHQYTIHTRNTNCSFIVNPYYLPKRILKLAICVNSSLIRNSLKTDMIVKFAVPRYLKLWFLVSATTLLHGTTQPQCCTLLFV